MVTYDVTIKTEHYLVIIRLSYDTMLLSLNDIEWFYNSINDKGSKLLKR